MPIVVERGQEDIVERMVRDRLRKSSRVKPLVDVVTHMERNFYIPETAKPIQLLDFQKAILLYAFPAALAVGYKYTTVVFSTVKKSGKTAVSAGIVRWIAEERTRMGTIFTMGNDAKQSKERAFQAAATSIRLTPGFRKNLNEGLLPERWVVQSTNLDCLTTGSRVQALAVDARGEAGSNPDLTVWTELWGFESKEALNFFDEMTPVPTKPSCRLVETYAGYDGESELLRRIYDQGMEEGRQLTAGELADETGVPLGAFEESPNAEDLVPIWVNEATGLFMYWDSGPIARRMPWQRGAGGERYYAEQAASLPPRSYERLHHNYWIGAEGEFIPLILWDNCYDETLQPLAPGDKTPAVLGVDAATTHDCFGVVLVTRHPERHNDVAIRQAKVWIPPKGGRIDYEGPESFIRTLCQGGCALGHPQYAPFFNEDSSKCDHKPTNGRACRVCCEACKAGALVEKYNIVNIAYDPYQLESMMQRFNKEGVAWCKQFSQGADRMEADKGFYDAIVSRKVSHRNDTQLNLHIVNCASKQSKDNDTKMRIVKKAPNRKVDLVVAASMAVHRCIWLNLSPVKNV